MMGEIVAVCCAASKGAKQPVERGTLRAGHGLEGDVHAGTWHRQISLLAEEHIEDMRRRGDLELPPGTFGENLICRGLDLTALETGRRLRLGEGAVIQLTQRGKECHTPCKIFHRVGECIMPTLGMFARVRRGGEVAVGCEVATDEALDRQRCAVITLSDRSAAGAREDTSGATVCELLERGMERALLMARTVLPDDRAAIEGELIRLCDEEVVDLVVTTGGTGLSPRDVTPEATLAVADRQIPGMAEAMRAAGLAHTPRAMLSRAVCAMRGQSIIVNLSGSPKAVREQLSVLLPVLPHALETATGVPMDCGRPDSSGRR